MKGIDMRGRTLPICLILFLWSITGSALSPLSRDDLKPVPLCRALENIRPGDQIRIVVSGIYAVDYLYNPDEPDCKMDIFPQTCVEFAEEVTLPEEFELLHDSFESKGVLVRFRGILYGPPRVPVPPFFPSVSPPYRALARNSALKYYCGNLYRTKLVVEAVESFGPVPEEIPWPEGQRQRPDDEPMPVEMALPRYPPIARNIDYEGVALVAVTVEDGKVTDAQMQFGDAVLVADVLANVQTWRFAPDVSRSFTVKYDFRLENRTVDQGTNPRYEMRLPTYIRVIGPWDDR